MQQGNTLSCGCLHSKGEAKIQQILRENNINYKLEKTFQDLKSNGINLRFNFIVFDDVKFLIEFDGIQHFKETSWCKDTLSERQERDQLKNEYCKQNNIPLIRIPYWEYDNLNIDMLKLETTKFLIT